MNRNNKIASLASAQLATFAARSTTYDVMADFQNKYQGLLKEYYESRLIILSSISLHRLESLQTWLPDLANNKVAITKLVSNMLEGCIYAINVYDTLYQYTKQPELVVDYSKIHRDEELKAQFNLYGGAEDSRAIISAIHWLESEEAVKTIAYNQEGRDTLCLVIDLLDTNNNFINCID